MADEQQQRGVSEAAIGALLAKLPREESIPELLTKRVRFSTADGRIFFAYARAGRGGGLAFAGWEPRADLPAGEEPDMDYFIIAAEKPGDPLQIINRQGPLGPIATADLEDRPS